MKKIFKYTKIILIPLLIYFCFAFMIWDLNPANWEIAHRVVCAFLMVSMTITFLVTEKFEK